jgi:hypothetical protein
MSGPRAPHSLRHEPQSTPLKFEEPPNQCHVADRALTGHGSDDCRRCHIPLRTEWAQLELLFAAYGLLDLARTLVGQARPTCLRNVPLS